MNRQRLLFIAGQGLDADSIWQVGGHGYERAADETTPANTIRIRLEMPLVSKDKDAVIVLVFPIPDKAFGVSESA